MTPPSAVLGQQPSKLCSSPLLPKEQTPRRHRYCSGTPHAHRQRGSRGQSQHHAQSAALPKFAWRAKVPRSARALLHALQLNLVVMLCHALNASNLTLSTRPAKVQGSCYRESHLHAVAAAAAGYSKHQHGCLPTHRWHNVKEHGRSSGATNSARWHACVRIHHIPRVSKWKRTRKNSSLPSHHTSFVASPARHIPHIPHRPSNNSASHNVYPRGPAALQSSSSSTTQPPQAR